MKILIITDSWHPLVNGVVRTLNTTVKTLEKWGHEIMVISPEEFLTVPCPTYPEIRLAIPWGLGRKIIQYAPDCVHVATEGPLGLAAVLWLSAHRWKFTTSYHTDFPSYLNARYGCPREWIYRYLRWFHNKARNTLVTTENLASYLRTWGFNGNLKVWSRGVDTDLFCPGSTPIKYKKHPIWLYVGRVAVEKGLEDFLNTAFLGTRIVVGSGPQLPELIKKYPEVIFTGVQVGQDLVNYYRSADVFVFPSQTDTFGLVQIESMACGTPVAALSNTLTESVITQMVTGSTSEYLLTAGLQALSIDRVKCAETARQMFCWEKVTRVFLDSLVKTKGGISKNY